MPDYRSTFRIDGKETCKVVPADDYGHAVEKSIRMAMENGWDYLTTNDQPVLSQVLRGTSPHRLSRIPA